VTDSTQDSRTPWYGLDDLERIQLALQVASEANLRLLRAAPEGQLRTRLMAGRERLREARWAHQDLSLPPSSSSL
jgi:hypothetical protein